MDKKIFSVYLAKLDTPDSEVQTRLELPASPWELHDAMDKVQLQENEELYLEVDDYYGFEYLAPHLDGADISLNELNDLAGQLAALDEVQGIAFEGLFSIEMQKKISTNGGIIKGGTPKGVPPSHKAPQRGSFSAFGQGTHFQETQNFR